MFGFIFDSNNVNYLLPQIVIPGHACTESMLAGVVIQMTCMKVNKEFPAMAMIINMKKGAFPPWLATSV